jgi:polyphenol oxidase
MASRWIVQYIQLAFAFHEARSMVSRQGEIGGKSGTFRVGDANMAYLRFCCNRCSASTPIFNPVSAKGMPSRVIAWGLILIGPFVLADFGRADVPEDCAFPAPPAPAVPFKPDAGLAVRTRKSAKDLDANDLDKLRRAYGALRKLHQNDPKDPRGWLQQGNVHCWYCGGGQDGMAGEEIHGSWWFFPWHRCYLYYHERILGKLIDDPSFALPYWNWGDDRAIPSAYVNPNDATNPLFDSLRGITPSLKLPDALVGTAVMRRIMNAPTYQLFMGTDADLPTASGGRLENGPHGGVHLWVGNPVTLVSTIDMGVLATAAQDPVFFAHHGNIDRLWDNWLKYTPTHQNPADKKWLNHKWFFYDENKQWTSITVADVLDHEKNLRYRYAEPKSMMFIIAGEPMSTQLGVEPLTRSVAVPASLLDRLGVHSTDVAPASVVASSVLHIDGIDVPPHLGGLVRVFINLPSATAATSIDDPHFVGYFTVLAKRAKAGGHEKKEHPAMNVAFDVPVTKMRELLANRDELSVTLVPSGAQNEKGQDMKLKFKKIYLAVK